MDSKQLGTSDLFRMVDQFHDSALLHFAHSVGLFELTSQPHHADVLAASMGWVPRKAVIFLNALVANGLLSKDDMGRYHNSLVADQSLVRSRDGYMGGVVEHQRRQWSTWTRIGETLSSTDVLPWHQEHKLNGDEAANEAFHQAMRNLAVANLPSFLSLPFPLGTKHVIDMAGSHGTYLAALARAEPEVTGEVWDYPGAERIAKETFREFGCSERCAFRAKDITLPASFAGVLADVVLLNDCLHYFEPATVRDLIYRAVEVLRSGGLLVVATQLLNTDGISPAAAAGFSMHMMLNTTHGGLHPTPWIEELLASAGLSVIQRPLDPTGRYVVVVGRKGDARGLSPEWKETRLEAQTP
ncbi:MULTISPECIES: methyltransferase [unclassified Bradyrhizobium]|uniref:methyltransferase n=1 Tax=unclassified Bradyrhizobium TaxID=2631580 RepID=UPI0028EB8A3A|nr:MULTISPECIES: methyltransferase [unclassified Bradyrhizobium]